MRRAPQPKRATIAELGPSRSTFYRWQQRCRDQGEVGLADRKPEPGAVWNRLRPEEQTVILARALQQPDLSPRELACYVTDHAGFTVSAATAYRVPKRHGLNRTIPLVGFPAGKEFREDDGAESVVAVRCQSLLRGRLGLVLLHPGAGRLLALRVGQRSETGHGIYTA